MKKLVVTLLLALLCGPVFGQSKFVERYRQDNKPETTLFFYKSTLRMFARVATNFAQDPEAVPADLPDLIDGIEKIKYFGYRYSSDQQDVFKEIRENVINEGYESVISGKIEQNNMEMLMKEKRGNPVGFVVITIGDEGLQLMDIEGVPDLNKLVKFVEYVSTSSDDFSWLNTFRDN